MPSSKVIKLAEVLPAAMLLRGNRYSIEGEDDPDIEVGLEPLDLEPEMEPEPELPAEPEPVDVDAVRAEVWRELQAEAEQLREQARDEGYREGMQQAVQEIGAQVMHMMQLAEGAMLEERQWLHAAEHDLVALALAVAEQVVNAELRTNPEVVAAAVRTGIEMLERGASVVVRVHPDDLADLQQYAPHLFAPSPEQRVTVTTDETVQPGGCVIDSGAARIDGQKSLVLEAVRTAFAEHLGGEL